MYSVAVPIFWQMHLNYFVVRYACLDYIVILPTS